MANKMRLHQSLLTMTLLTAGLVYAATLILQKLFGLKFSHCGMPISNENFLGTSVFFDHLIFITIFSIGCAVTGVHRLKVDTHSLYQQSLSKLYKYTWHLLALCILGGFFNLIDKYLIIQKYPINCLSQIRFAWISVASEGRDAYHQVFSYIGNGLSSLLFPSLIILNSHIQASSKKLQMKQFAQVLILTILVVIYSLSFGSRNLMFAFASVTFCGSLLFLVFNPSMQNLIKTLVTSVLILIVSVGFTYFFTKDRIFCVPNHHQILIEKNGIQGVLDQEALYIDGYRDEVPICMDADGLGGQTALAKTCAPCALAAIYLNHGLANHRWIFSEELVGKNYILNFLHANLGSMSPFGKVQCERSFVGGMSMVGSVRHDFGYPGIVVFAIICSLILMAIAKGLRLGTSKLQISAIFCLHCFFYSITVSPMFFPIMTMPFKIFIFGLLFLATVAFFTRLIFERITDQYFSPAKTSNTDTIID